MCSRWHTDTAVAPDDWQSRIPPLGFIRQIECTFSLPGSGDGSQFHSEAFTPDTKGWVYMLNCPMPEELESVLSAESYASLQLEIHWTLDKANKPFVSTVTLSPQTLDPVQEVSAQSCPVFPWLKS